MNKFQITIELEKATDVADVYMSLRHLANFIEECQSLPLKREVFNAGRVFGKAELKTDRKYVYNESKASQ